MRARGVVDASAFIEVIDVSSVGRPEAGRVSYADNLMRMTEWSGGWIDFDQADAINQAIRLLDAAPPGQGRPRRC